MEQRPASCAEVLAFGAGRVEPQPRELPLVTRTVGVVVNAHRSPFDIHEGTVAAFTPLLLHPSLTVTEDSFTNEGVTAPAAHDVPLRAPQSTPARHRLICAEPQRRLP